jgi:hypothetical protein
MHTSTMKPLPRWSSVAREQFRVLPLALRREAIAFGLILLGLTLLFLWEYLRSSTQHEMHARWNLAPSTLFPVVLIGFFAPLSIWKADEPSRRGYHWAMPVDSWHHSQAKVLSGWAWTMIAVLVLASWMALVALLLGGEIGQQRVGFLSPDAFATLSPADQDRAAWQVPAWQWIAPFTGATIAYLFGTALVLYTDHAWRWIGGFVVGLFVLMAVSAMAGAHWVIEVVANVVSGRFGLTPALTGGVPVRETFEWMSARGTNTVTADVSRPDLGAWIGATLLWFGLGAALVSLAARKQEH